MCDGAAGDGRWGLRAPSWEEAMAAGQQAYAQGRYGEAEPLEPRSQAILTGAPSAGRQSPSR